jgi:hypothetical protein
MGHAKPTALERALHGKRTSMKPRKMVQEIFELHQCSRLQELEGRH